jgi:hypothetical protein
MMKKNKNQLIIKSDRDDRTFVLNGKKYRLVRVIVTKKDHLKGSVFEQVDEKKYKKRLEALSDYLITGSKITMKDVLISVLKTISIEDLEKLEQKAKKKVQPKIYRGCIGLTLGNSEIIINE